MCKSYVNSKFSTKLMSIEAITFVIVAYWIVHPITLFWPVAYFNLHILCPHILHCKEQHLSSVHKLIRKLFVIFNSLRSWWYFERENPLIRNFFVKKLNADMKIVRIGDTVDNEISKLWSHKIVISIAVIKPIYPRLHPLLYVDFLWRKQPH